MAVLRPTLRSHDMFLFFVLVVSISPALALGEFPKIPLGLGQLVNFSVPCDLNSAIAIPDRGGLLRPVLLGIGYQEYRFDGSNWDLIDESGVLLNKSLSRVGTLGATSPSSSDSSSVTFELFPRPEAGYDFGATVTAASVVSVRQAFAIPLQLLNTTAAVNESTYSASDYVQRFGTQAGLPPSAEYTARAKIGDTFKSRFSAFYAFYLPFDSSPQLATRVPRCGDERFYGLQYGRDFP